MGDHETHGGGDLTAEAASAFAAESKSESEAAAAAADAGRRLFLGTCTFIKGVVALRDLPDADRPEVAFCGRSNVGKSSLINALTGRKALARTSKTPGRTQQINYFDLDGGSAGQLYLVDLPGYGYAQAARAAVERWTRLIKAYLKGRPTLRRVCLLIDARRGLGPADHEIMAMLDTAAVSYQAVLTKADKLKADALERVCTDLAAELRRHAAAHPRLIVTSAQTGLGIDDLRAALATLAARP